MDYSNTGGMRSPFSPRVRQTIGGRRFISTKKNHGKSVVSTQQQCGDVIYKTALSIIETYGPPLPVMVTEALTFASGDVSVNMSPCGWCWVVTNRRVLAWPREPSGMTSGPTAARELTLPQTDLAHKADLVLIFYEDNSQAMPSCVGVSPEGVVRYWASVGQEGAYSEVSCELAGQECDRLVSRTDDEGVAVGSLLLATTTCSLVRIQTSREGRPTVSCQTLRPPSGWLGGIGRRVSLLFFGSMLTHADTKLVGVVILPPLVKSDDGDVEGSEGEECICLLAGGPLLQLWCGSELHEHHLRRPISEALVRAHLAPIGEGGAVELSAVDAQAAPGEPRALWLLLLLPAPAPAGAPRAPHDIRYALAHISVERADSPRVLSVCGVGWGREGEPPRLLPLAPAPAQRALLYTHNYLAVVSNSAGEKCEYIDVRGEGDRVVGAGAAGSAGEPLLLTHKHGLLALRHAPTNLHHAHCATVADVHDRSLSRSPLGSPCPSDMYEGNLLLYEMDPNEVSAVCTDACGRLKTALVLQARGSSAAARRTLEETFGAGGVGAGADEPLDRALLALAAEMLDDAPAGDPRWRIATGVSLGSSSALQGAGQLLDKRRVLTMLLDMLREHGYYQRLAAVSREDGSGYVRTTERLRALVERLAAATAVQRLHQSGDRLIDTAMQQVCTRAALESAGEEREVISGALSGSLSAGDVCVRRVTCVLRVLRALCSLPPPAHPLHAADHVRRALDACTEVLGEMQKMRAQWGTWNQGGGGGAGGGGGEVPCLAELTPWSALAAMLELHTHALGQYSAKCPDASMCAQLMESAGRLAERLVGEGEVLGDQQLHPHYQLHRDLRRQLIQPYVSAGELERAAGLAERSRELALLVDMFVGAGDVRRLCDYIDKYIDQGMAEVAFAHLLSGAGRLSAVLVREVGGRHGARLRRWLRAAPDPARRRLLALHLLHARRHRPAASALLHLADAETGSVRKMQTMASLAKLSLLADEEEGEEGRAEAWTHADKVLSLAAQHHALPRELRLHCGLGDDCAPLQPEQLAQMYAESESRALSEYDYKKALDLLEFVEDECARDRLRLQIWTSCILRDEWSSWRDGDGTLARDPQLDVQDKKFFKLLELLNVMGSPLERYVPPLRQLERAPELADLAADPRALYLLKYTHETLLAV